MANERAGRNETPPVPSVPNPCSICKTPIFGSFIGTGDGSMKNGGSFAHPVCYYRNEAHVLRTELRYLIADDAYAATFQSLGQYRTALLRYLKGDREALPTNERG